ncbi:hypothetical protein [Sinobaca sp. H24]|uniref:hypothetical protein n=1 Tax=Sinobaca sp. H24 TaxID=2923376 RepID=UPI00207982B9|nr:hypothetical protein [Sinobaca sp. H24]
MADFIYHAASVTDGRVLILFTSFDMLADTYHMLREWDEMNSFTIIAQGIHSGSKSKLLKNVPAEQAHHSAWDERFLGRN